VTRSGEPRRERCRLDESATRARQRRADRWPACRPGSRRALGEGPVAWRRVSLLLIVVSLAVLLAPLWRRGSGRRFVPGRGRCLRLCRGPVSDGRADTALCALSHSSWSTTGRHRRGRPRGCDAPRPGPPLGLDGDHPATPLALAPVLPARGASVRGGPQRPPPPSGSDLRGPGRRDHARSALAGLD
jgi:hypothetical protein